MAGTVHDLPDPLDDRRAAAPASPDDLLMQMADDAIDKLIAEADMHPGPHAPPLPVAAFEPPIHPPTTATPPVSSVPSHDQPDVPLIESTLPSTVDAPAIATAVPSLQSVLTAADASPAPLLPAAPEVAAVAAAPTAPQAPAAIPQPPPAPAAAPPADLPTTSADIKALLAVDAPAAGEKQSILLLPLQVLSAPLTHADDRIRNAVGQIAIVTLLNAIAVLIYVLVVRHK